MARTQTDAQVPGARGTRRTGRRESGSFFSQTAGSNATDGTPEARGVPASVCAGHTRSDCTAPRAQRTSVALSPWLEREPCSPKRGGAHRWFACGSSFTAADDVAQGTHASELPPAPPLHPLESAAPLRSSLLSDLRSDGITR